MAFEKPCGRKLSEFMAHHVFRNEDGDELLAVMDRQSMSDHVRDHGGPPGPGLQNPLLSAGIHVVNAGQQPGFDKWTFRD
jgi:hypothetical protein